MSILIKGMEMPQNCDKCRFQSALKLYCDAMPYNFCGNTDDIERPDWCPLIEVPTPHGDLVDRNGLMDIYADRLTAVAERYSPDSSECGILSGAMKLLAIMPTVIEAED